MSILYRIVRLVINAIRKVIENAYGGLKKLEITNIMAAT